MVFKRQRAYQLQTAYGILKHHYGARHLERVPAGVLSAIPDNPAVITLRVAAKAMKVMWDK